MALTFDDLYRLAEELQQLQGASLQGVHHPSQLRYTLEFRLIGESRFVVIDLTPSQPLIVSTSSTKLKSLPKKTPVWNFLRAHFVGLRFHIIEVAQKPNRLIRLHFKNDDKEAFLTFKCFPHGQHLVLNADDKIVQFPLRATIENEERVTFIDPEKIKGWEVNDLMARDLLNEKVKPSQAEPYHAKLVKKLERAIEALEKSLSGAGDEDAQKILELETEAAEPGADIQTIFDEIKRVKKKKEVALARRKDLQDQLKRLKDDPTSVAVPPTQKEEKSKKESGDIFSGTRVKLSPQWELWVGRTAWQNDDLVRLASPHDLWIHLRDYPGAHGVIRGLKTEPPTHLVEMSCLIVAILSQSKKNPFGEGEKIDFIVTPKKFVKKPKGAAPGRVIVEREKVRRVAFRNVKFEVI